MIEALRRGRIGQALDQSFAPQEGTYEKGMADAQALMPPSSNVFGSGALGNPFNWPGMAASLPPLVMHKWQEFPSWFKGQMQTAGQGVTPEGRLMTGGDMTEQAGAAFDIASMAPLGAGGFAAAGIAAVPDGAVGSFAGSSAARNLAKQGDDRPLRAMELAEKMKAAGADPIRIYERTNDVLDNSQYAGVHYGADGKPRFEISDDGMTYNPGPPQRRFLRKDGPNIGSQVGLDGPQITHDELAKAYPELSSRRIDTKSGPSVAEDGGWALARIKAEGADDMIPPIVAHELQHEIQRAEGFSQGSNMNWVKGHPDYAPPSREDRMMNEYMSKTGDIDAELLYREMKGEVEARNVEKRLNMTAEERRRTPPWQTQDTPYAAQSDNAKPWQRAINRLFQPFWSSRLGQRLEAEEYLMKAGTKEAFADYGRMKKLEDDIRAAEADWTSVNPMIGHNSRNRVIDPSNIRSVNAAFDPAKKDSANLLAANNAMLGATASVPYSNEAIQSRNPLMDAMRRGGPQ